MLLFVVGILSAMFGATFGVVIMALMQAAHKGG